MPSPTDKILELIVAESGEPKVYHVWHNGGLKHRVELRGHIRCDCPDWQCRRWPAIKDGKPLLTDATLCRHGKAALRHHNLTMLKTP